MAQTERVPELSLNDYTDGTNDAKQAFIQDLFEGLKRFGFIILKDHPIQLDLLDRAYTLSREFFELPEEVKRKYVSASGGGRRGYTPFGKEHAKDQSVPDLKEFWHVGRELASNHRYFNDSEFPQNLWPQEIPEFKATFLSLYETLDEVGHIILQALAEPLKVAPNYFDEMIEDGSSLLRLLHYPPIPEGADPRCIRAAAHEDINLITILVSASASGLQLLNRQGEWLPIETEANNLIVDAGDMLARITNDVIPSTTHRVVNPEDGNFSRYSMPYFIHPHPHAVLTCLDSCRGPSAKYPDITAGEFLNQRLREIGLA